MCFLYYEVDIPSTNNYYPTTLNCYENNLQYL